MAGYKFGSGSGKIILIRHTCLVVSLMRFGKWVKFMHVEGERDSALLKIIFEHLQPWRYLQNIGSKTIFVVIGCTGTWTMYTVHTVRNLNFHWCRPYTVHTVQNVLLQLNCCNTYLIGIFDTIYTNIFKGAVQRDFQLSAYFHQLNPLNL